MVNKRLEAKKLQKERDKEWADIVKGLYNNECAVCGNKERLNAHHLIPRQIKEFRHDIRNGIALCPKHHRFSFELSAHQNPIVFYALFAVNQPVAHAELMGMINERKWKK